MIVVVLLDKPVAFFFTFPLSSLSLLLKLLNNETPAEANGFISPSPIIKIHVGFPGNDPGKFKGAGGGVCSMQPETLSFFGPQPLFLRSD